MVSLDNKLQWKYISIIVGAVRWSGISELLDEVV